jgi:predicted nuclease of restriction endonuclease-like (RecB) superfamily
MSKEKSIQIVDFENIVQLINDARNRAFSKVNEELIFLYFNVGQAVSAKVAGGIWGEGTIDELANHIAVKLPGIGGFNRRGLYRMKQFFETYSVDSDCYQLWLNVQTIGQNPIVSPLATQLQYKDNQHNKFVSTVLTQIQWSSHLHILSKTKTSEEKLFYLLLAINEKLSVRELERQLNSAVFERTLLAKQKVSALLTQLPDNLFKDPYIFEFLDLPDGHSEKDLEKALIFNLQKFILEIGKGFTYLGNQYRLQVGNKDYYTDLLFYHRDLQCLVLFELKIQEFEPEFLGKLNFYLEALDRDVKRSFENPSVGVLLCKGKDTEVVEYAMARNTSPAMIADYETKLIPKNILANKLHQLVEQLSKEEIN